MKLNGIFANIKGDALSGFVVFLVAVPLCLGIALASGAPLFAGMIAGIIGGMVVGSISKSPLSVSGPAAGLTAICLSSIQSLGSFELFLTATVLAGGIQIILSILKAGSIAYYFPSNVIKGMLTGIGIIIILKQLPHLVGYDSDPEGDLKFIQANGENSFSAILSMLNNIHLGAVIIGVSCLALIFIWDKFKPIKLVPGALVAVLVGIVLNFIFNGLGNTWLTIQSNHLVNLPVLNSLSEVGSVLTLPDFNGITNGAVWKVALTLGIIASVETLLTIEATDKMDPQKRVTPTNRELFAQGIGNMTSGIIGGLPITSVIVRSSANINSGGRTKMSTIIHGTLLLLGVLFFANYLNKIPLAALAAVLIATGYKLCNPTVFKTMFSKTKYQWVPFLITVLAVVFTDLLIGVSIGMIVSTIAILLGNIKNSYLYHESNAADQKIFTMILSEEVSFLNKASIRLTLDKIKEGKTILIDATNSSYIDHDVLEVIKEFRDSVAPAKNIQVILRGFKDPDLIKNNDHTFEHIIPPSIKMLEVKKEFAKPGNLSFAAN